MLFPAHMATLCEYPFQHIWQYPSSPTPPLKIIGLVNLELKTHGKRKHTHEIIDNFYELMALSRTTISQDVQTRFPLQLAFAKFLSKIKGNF